MKQHLFGFVGLSLAVALAAGCKSNPQSGIDQVPAAIKLTASHIVVNVADSVRVDAQVVDAQGTPLTTLPDAKSNDPTVMSLSTIDPYPVPETSFWVRGETFGAGTITVTSGSLSATITVQTYPKAAKVGNAPADTILSGTTTAPYPIALDANGDSIAAPADSFSWTVDNENSLTADPVTGAGVAKQPGPATITLHVAGGGTGVAPTIVIPDTTVPVTATPDSAVNLQHVTIDLPATTPAVDGNTAVQFYSFLGLIGRDPATVVSKSTHQIVISVPADLPTDSTYDVVVTGLGPDEYSVMTRVTVIPPPAFTGTFSDNTPNTAQLVTATRNASGPLFDLDTKVQVGGINAFVESVATDGSTITFAIPYEFSAGDNVSVTFLQLDVDQQARTTNVTINAVGTDPSGPADTSAATAPVISANGNYFALLTSTDPGQYAGLVGGVANFFTITAGATDLNLTVTMDWDAPGATTGDMDLYLCANACTSGGDFGSDGYGAASSAKPESEDITIPAGTTMHLMMVRYAAGVSAGDLIRVNVTGF